MHLNKRFDRRMVRRQVTHQLAVKHTATIHHRGAPAPFFLLKLIARGSARFDALCRQVHACETGDGQLPPPLPEQPYYRVQLIDYRHDVEDI